MQYTDIDDLSSNSGHGPALDGRAVPALVAPGCSEDSAASATGYDLMCGTSMASPQVTGATALFVERYRAAQGQDPSPALVKAAFTAVARNLTGHRDADGQPLLRLFDSKQGWGRLQTTPVLAPAREVVYIDQSVVFENTGQSWSQGYVADDPAVPMRIMLVWTDAPGHGLGGTTPAWNNDLALRVTAGSSLYRGNVLDAAGWSQTGGLADDRNNMEAVFLQPAQHGGAVTIEVLASAVNSDALPNSGDGTQQDFALVCYNCREQSAAISDLAVSASAGSAWAVAGEPLALTAEVVNTGAAAAADVRVSVHAPGLASPVVAPGGGWTCGASLVLLTCTHDTPLAAGASVALPFTALVRASAADPLLVSFTARTASAEPNQSNNSAQLSLPLLDRIFADDFEENGAP